MGYVYLNPAAYVVGKPISFEEYAQLVDNANEAYNGATAHGEVFATRASATGVGVTVSGTAPGPYTLTVPAGVTRMMLSIVGGGGGYKSSAPTSQGVGGTSTVSGSTSGTLATANGGANGFSSPSGGAASGRCFAGGDGIGNVGGGAAGPHFGGAKGQQVGTDYVAPPGGFGGTAYVGTGSVQATGYGNGGYVSGGAAGGQFMITVVPGETLTLTVAAGGTPDSGFPQYAGAPGMIRLEW